jgi:hypothetical protein
MWCTSELFQNFEKLVQMIELKSFFIARSIRHISLSYRIYPHKNNQKQCAGPNATEVEKGPRGTKVICWRLLPRSRPATIWTEREGVRAALLVPLLGRRLRSGLGCASTSIRHRAKAPRYLPDQWAGIKWRDAVEMLPSSQRMCQMLVHGDPSGASLWSSAHPAHCSTQEASHARSQHQYSKSSPRKTVT